MLARGFLLLIHLACFSAVLAAATTLDVFTLSKTLVGGSPTCNAQVNSVQSFTTDDEDMYIIAVLRGLDSGLQYEVTLTGPDGSSGFYGVPGLSWKIGPLPTIPGLPPIGCLTDNIPIATATGLRNGVLAGTWTAKMYIGGIHKDTLTFEIKPGAGDRLPSIAAVFPSTYVTGSSAAGSLITLVGKGFCNLQTSLVAPANFYPNILGGVQVFMQAVSATGPSLARLQYIGPAGVPGYCQINAQVPFGLSQETYRVYLRDTAGKYSNPALINVVEVNPSFFSAPPAYPVLLQIASRGYTIMTAANPVYPGENLVGYADGFGQTVPPRATGSALSGQFGYVAAKVDAWLKSCLGSDCTINSATVIYAVAYPGIPAAYQVAFRLPQIPVDLSRRYSLIVQVGGVFAPDLPLNLAPKP